MIENTKLVEAMLTMDIEYSKDGSMIIVGKDTHILVDRVKNVALILGTHVDVDPNEYRVIYFN